MSISIPSMFTPTPVPFFGIDPASSSSAQTTSVKGVNGQCFATVKENGTAVAVLTKNNIASGNWSINNLSDCSSEQRLSLSNKASLSFALSDDAKEIVTVTAQESVMDAIIATFSNALVIELETAIQQLRDAAEPNGSVIIQSLPGWATTQSGLEFDVGAFILKMPFPIVKSKAYLRQQVTCSLGRIIRFSVSVSAIANLSSPYCTVVNLGSGKQAASIVGDLYEDGDLLAAQEFVSYNVYLDTVKDLGTVVF